jgi:hypothetical protein
MPEAFRWQFKKNKNKSKVAIIKQRRDEMKSYVGGKTITITLPTITCTPDKRK